MLFLFSHRGQSVALQCLGCHYTFPLQSYGKVKYHVFRFISFVSD